MEFSTFSMRLHVNVHIHLFVYIRKLLLNNKDLWQNVINMVSLVRACAKKEILKKIGISCSYA